MRVLHAIVAGVGAVSLLCGCSTAAAPVAAAASWSIPPAHGRFDYQIGGAYAPAADVRIVDRDRSDAPDPHRYTICYVNGFQTQPGERQWWERHHSDLLLHRSDGTILRDPDWPDEDILDISTVAKRAAVAAIERPWIDGCAARGFRGLELDNLDTYTRGYPRLTRADALSLAGLLVRRAHADHLAAAQKNTPELGSAGRRTGFDFAIAEECQRYAECASYTRVYGAHVIEIEYTDYSRSVFRAACAARGSRVSLLLRDRDVVPRSDPAYVSEWC